MSILRCVRRILGAHSHGRFAGMLLSAVLSVCLCSEFCSAQPQTTEKPLLRMRIELLSIRNRSASPIPVQIKLEYNDPKILEGDLELSLYDAREVMSQEDLRATLVFEDLVLSGSDLIFNAVLPPIQTSETQNLAIIAWFQTADQRIPLSSSLKEPVPPVAHDLLMISPSERSTLVCSCHGSLFDDRASASRAFLEQSLSLENYNPRRSEPESNEDSAAAPVNDRSRLDETGRHVQHYSISWSVSDLPEDPLSCCCFDLVLLADGALAQLSDAQMKALTIWVRAGGSICMVSDAPLRPPQLEFLRDLLTEPGQSAFAGLLDDQGQLQFAESEVPRLVLSRQGLGRAALIPSVDRLMEAGAEQTLGRLVGFLWNVRQDVPVHQGKPWELLDLLALARADGIELETDERGYYVNGHVQPNYGDFGSPQRARFVTVKDENAPRVYYSAEVLQNRFQLSAEPNLAPVAGTLTPVATQYLLPPGVETVPAWVIGLILAGYVITIGPVDYFVLGMLRIRKATWVVFPVVTGLFTMLTIATARHYLGSSDTGGSLEITDIVNDGTAIRSTKIEMAFYGSQTTMTTDHRMQLIVDAADRTHGTAVNSLDPYGRGRQFGQQQESVHGNPLHYSGHFPQNYKVARTVQQWSPQLTRTFQLQPGNVNIPNIDWQDGSLVSTEAGRAKLAAELKKSGVESGTYSIRAVVLNRTLQHDVLNWSAPVASEQSSSDEWRSYQAIVASRMENYLAGMPAAIITSTVAAQERGMFQLVSRVAPQGSALLEDLRLLDPSDGSEWVLIIMEQDENRYQVFRKLYTIPETAEAGANDSE